MDDGIDGGVVGHLAILAALVCLNGMTHKDFRNIRMETTQNNEVWMRFVHEGHPYITLAHIFRHLLLNVIML